MRHTTVMSSKSIFGRFKLRINEFRHNRAAQAYLKVFDGWFHEVRYDGQVVGLHHTNASLFVAGQPESNSHLIRLGVVADGKLTLVSERN